jgi:hypothetical protein
MHGTILIYGNDAIWLATSSLILEKAGYEVLSAISAMYAIYKAPTLL